MRGTWIKAVCGFLIPILMICWMPASAHAGGISLNDEDSSDGAIITLGLFAVVVGVLFIVGLKTDVEDYLSKNTELDERKLVEAERGVSRVLDGNDERVDINAAAGSRMARNNAIGLGFSF